MDDIFGDLTDAAQAATGVIGAVKQATSSPAPAKVTPPVSTAPSYTKYYVIGGAVLAVLAVVFFIMRRK